MKIVYFIYKTLEGSYRVGINTGENIQKWKANLKKEQLRGITQGVLFEGSNSSERYKEFPLTSKVVALVDFIGEANLTKKFNPKELEEILSETFK